MTKVNLVLPFFEASIKTNNSDVISEIVKQKYGFSNCSVTWMNNPQQKDSFQCAIKIEHMNLNMNDILLKLEKAQQLQQSLSRMKIDIFNMVKKYQQLLMDRKVGLNLQKIKEMVVNQIEDSEVSLKIEEKDRQGGVREKEIGLNEQQYLIAISELTRENIKLKDALIYYQSQMQAFVRSNQQSMEKRQGSK